LLIAAIGASRLGAFAYGAIAGTRLGRADDRHISCRHRRRIHGAHHRRSPKPLIWGVDGLRRPRRRAILAGTGRRSSSSRRLMAGIDTLDRQPHRRTAAPARSPTARWIFMPAIQVASLGGAPAITFVVTLFASAIAISHCQARRSSLR
jgi:hypothetical protein